MSNFILLESFFCLKKHSSESKENEISSSVDIVLRCLFGNEVLSIFTHKDSKQGCLSCFSIFNNHNNTSQPTNTNLALKSCAGLFIFRILTQSLTLAATMKKMPTMKQSFTLHQLKMVGITVQKINVAIEKL